MFKRVLAALSVLSLSLGIAAVASGDDRSEAMAVLGEVGRDTAHRSVVQPAVEQSKTALERATRMRAAGDETHARLADGLALDWALVAQDLLATATVEESAKAAHLDVLDAGARVERERALLEEDIARTGRLRAELDGLQKSEREAPRTSQLGARPAREDAGAAPGPSPRAASDRPHRKAAADGGAP